MSTGVPPWTWRELDAEKARKTWEAVAKFVDWLVRRYDLGDVVPSCWWNHGAITEELTALWATWTASYLAPDAAPDAPIIWHERFQQFRTRLGEWDRLGCAQRGHRDGVPSVWEPDTEAFWAAVAADCAGRPDAEQLAEEPGEPGPDDSDDLPDDDPEDEPC